MVRMLKMTRTSHAPADLVSYLWNSLAATIPRCLEYGDRSEHYFETANTVFRSVDSEIQVQLDLDAYASTWCSLLLRHTHTEVSLEANSQYRADENSLLVVSRLIT